MSSKPSTEVDYQARIDRALGWLEEHLREEVRPQDLARVAAFSPYHFHRVFRGVTGESVMQCVRRLRLEWAARRLRHSEESITDVALRSGYASHEAFTRAFAAHFGAPPKVWRAAPAQRIYLVDDRPEPAHVDIREVGPRPYLFRRGRGAYSEVGASWEAFMSGAARSGWFTGREQLAGVYPDDPEITPSGQLRYQVGLIPSAHLTELPQGCELGTLPAGQWAVAVHTGPYSRLHETYLRLVGHWFVARGLPLADLPCVELYLDLPGSVPDAELRTEVWAPIAG